jgi:signal peptidase I
MTNQHHAREGIKDTIESIVIALVLAFVFRAFVVEAFVIPTGSMAPTLYGAHATIICEDCGYEFAYGLKDPDDKRGTEFVRGDNASAPCPNCNHVNRNLEVRDDSGSNSPPEKGDRILVLKWPFDLGGRGLDPARWDVIVFKDPSDGTTNFIKRCAGLPNEVLAVIDGDVYTVPLSELSEATRAEFETGS